MKRKRKEELRALSVKELQKILKDLDKQKRKLEGYMMAKAGSSVVVRNYPSQKQEWTNGNLKQIRKDIARVKTFINEKNMEKRK